MIQFKKVILAFSLLLASCSSDQAKNLNAWMQEKEKIKILSTTSQIGDLVSAIGGDRVHNWVLIHGGLDPHSYELVKGDDEKLIRADLIVYNGLGLEHGASLSTHLLKHPKAFPIGEKIAQLAPEEILQKNGTIDPHLWMDISLWKQGIEPLVSLLSQMDPEGANEYRKRGKELEKKMDETHEEILSLISSIPKEKRYLVTSHDAFQYFSRRYLAGSAAPEGLAPDGQIGSLDIRRILNFLVEHQVFVIFPESNVSRDSLGKIASVGREMKIFIQISPEPLYGDETGGLPYLEMMKKNGETISRNLQ